VGKGVDTIYRLSGAFVAGTGIGLLYFGGLWLTVRLVVGMRRPLLLTFLSFGARVLLAAGAFYLVMDGEVGRLMASLFGFLAIRVLLLVGWHRTLRWRTSDGVANEWEG
jgi:F1F0 ATPase subunit 2